MKISLQFQKARKKTFSFEFVFPSDCVRLDKKKCCFDIVGEKLSALVEIYSLKTQSAGILLCLL